MCGIAGLVGFDSTPEETVCAVREMLPRLRQRGPDDEGLLEVRVQGLGGVFGHRRLAVQDLSAEGRQPLSRGNWTVTYNGEIYNAPELRKELEEHGCSFRSHCDTEVLCWALETWGLHACLDRVNGMFAFAATDGQSLHLVRDRVGIKPLYWWRGPDARFAFASELSALEPVPGFERKIDPFALDNYLVHGYVPAPLCIYRNCGKLVPGSILTYADGRISTRRYWAPSPEETGSFDGDETDALTELEGLLLDSVQRRRLSDVPLGAFLSGGIDSSLVCALAQQRAGGNLQTFAVGFGYDEYDESPHAERVAAHLGTEHTTVHMDERDLLDIVPKVPALYGEPFSDASALPTYLLCQATRQHVTVALSGDGGDEQFFGYNRYLSYLRMRKYECIPPVLRRALGEWVCTSFPRDGLGRWGKAFSYRCFDEAALYFVGIFHRLFFDRLTGRDFDIERSPLHQWFEELEPHRLGAAQAGPMMDLRFYLPDDVLCKVDRASMAHSLEVRVPLLDHRAVEFANRLPHAMKFRRNERKYLLKKLLDKYVPRGLWDRPKQGFGAPLDHWFRNELRPLLTDHLGESAIAGHPLFDADFVHRRLQDHLAGRKNNQHFLWTLLVFEMWRKETGASL